MRDGLSGLYEYKKITYLYMNSAHVILAFTSFFMKIQLKVNNNDAINFLEIKEKGKLS